MKVDQGSRTGLRQDSKAWPTERNRKREKTDSDVRIEWSAQLICLSLQAQNVWCRSRLEKMAATGPGFRRSDHCFLFCSRLSTASNSKSHSMQLTLSAHPNLISSSVAPPKGGIGIGLSLNGSEK